MQEDFHYLMVKVLAHHAGFLPEEAETIAYASQYTDDAVEHLPLHIEGMPQVDMGKRVKGTFFDPICTAHKGIEYLAGITKDVQKKVYASFHFIPAEKYSGNGAYDYCVVPNGSLARLLVMQSEKRLESVDPEERSKGLIQLGIALHSFADTWSHHRFSGRRSAFDNDIERIEILNGERLSDLDKFVHGLLNCKLFPKVGHLEALDLPDMSNMHWKYEHNASKQDIKQDNTQEFYRAAFDIFQILSKINKTEAGSIARWKSIADGVKTCLSEPITSISEKYRFYKSQFPEIELIYDKYRWRRQAIKDGSLSWEDFDKSDYNSQKYEYNGDPKWFYFHEAAYHQRALVMKSIKKDLL